MFVGATDTCDLRLHIGSQQSLVQLSTCWDSFVYTKLY